MPVGCPHNAHTYYALLAPEVDREKLLDKLRHNDIWAVFHYIPCTHRPPAGVLPGPWLAGYDEQAIPTPGSLTSLGRPDGSAQEKVVYTLQAAAGL